jgi:2-polyprenyl-3-methyl-5-hydroxy-6-metoxy-1,4-benzoquinol methylase
MKEEWYQEKKEVLGGSLRQKYRDLEPILKRMAPKRSVLDIGCNGGVVSMLSAKYGASKVAGIDKRGYAIEQANMGADAWAAKGLLKNKDIISYYNGNLADNLELVDQADFLIMLRVIYHLREEVVTLFERIKDRSDMIILVQGNPARRKKAAAEKTALGNKLALSPAISSFLESYNFITKILPNEIVIARHKNSKFNLNKI